MAETKKYYDLLNARENKPNVEKLALTSFYEQLILMLDEEEENGYLSETNRNTIISLLALQIAEIEALKKKMRELESRIS